MRVPAVPYDVTGLRGWLQWEFSLNRAASGCGIRTGGCTTENSKLSGTSATLGAVIILIAARKRYVRQLLRGVSTKGARHADEPGVKIALGQDSTTSAVQAKPEEVVKGQPSDDGNPAPPHTLDPVARRAGASRGVATESAVLMFLRQAIYEAGGECLCSELQPLYWQRFFQPMMACLTRFLTSFPELCSLREGERGTLVARVDGGNLSDNSLEKRVLTVSKAEGLEAGAMHVFLGFLRKRLQQKGKCRVYDLVPNFARANKGYGYIKVIHVLREAKQEFAVEQGWLDAKISIKRAHGTEERSEITARFGDFPEARGAGVLAKEQRVHVGPPLDKPMLYCYAEWYTHAVGSRTPHALRPKPSPEDVERLTYTFKKHVAKHGFLTSDVVRAEIDLACSARCISEQQLFASSGGMLLKGFAKMLMVVDMAVQICLATQVFLTLYDLELAILEHRVFRDRRSLEDACLGKLQYHPEVARHFFPGRSIPQCVPRLTTWVLIQELCLIDAKPEPTTGCTPLQSGLQDLANSLGLRHYRDLGLYVSEDAVLRGCLPHPSIASTSDWRGIFQDLLKPLALEQRQARFASDPEESCEYDSLVDMADGKVGPNGTNRSRDSQLSVESAPLAEERERERQDVADQFVKILRGLSNGSMSSRDQGAAGLEAVGRAEAMLCHARGLAVFEDLDLDLSFGEFLALYSRDILGAVGPLCTRQQPGMDRLIQQFCEKLLAASQTRDDVAAAVQHRFGISREASLRMISASINNAASEAGVFARASVVDVEVAVATACPLPASAAAEWYTNTSPVNIVEAAAQAIMSVPPLVDLAHALPTWGTEFAPILGDLGAFVRSAEFSAHAGPNDRILSLCLGTLVRLPISDSIECLGDAIAARDPYIAASIALSRVLRDGKAFPSQLFEEVVATALAAWVNESSGVAEVFVLEAIAFLPARTPQAAIFVFGRSYRTLQRPCQELAAAAATSVEFQAALHCLGFHLGVDEWTRASWSKLHGTRHVMKPGRTRQPEKLAPSVKKDLSRECRSEPVVPATLASQQSGPQNQDLCRDIARLKYVNLDHVDLQTRQWIHPPTDKVVLSLQRTLLGTVRHLAAELYSSESHFILELIQNADDCYYPNDQTPALRVTYETDCTQFSKYTSFESSGSEALLVFEYNECGFTEHNVRAICDLDRSTKHAGEIGKKGIGFKSTFMATPTPVVHSGHFNFHFDRDGLDGLGYLVPFPLPSLPHFDFNSGTRIVLPLGQADEAQRLHTCIVEDLHAVLLLFLRRLDRLVVSESSGGMTKDIRKEVSRPVGSTDGEDIVLRTQTTIDDVGRSTTTTEVQKWFLHTTPVPSPVSETDSVVTELKLAFLLDVCKEDTSGVPQQQRQHQQQPLHVFAWLPLRSYGFHFIVQADWEVPSSREAITSASPLNQRIRAVLPEAFAAATLKFVERACKETGRRICVQWLDCEATSSTRQTRGRQPDGLAPHQGHLRAPNRIRSMSSDASVAACILAPLYKSIPLPGSVMDFFASTPTAIIQKLREIPCILVRRWIAAHGEKPEYQCLEFVRPGVVVSAKFPDHVTHQVPSGLLVEGLCHLEPVLASLGMYVETGGLPSHIAQALGVRQIDGQIALQCLNAFAKGLVVESQGDDLLGPMVETLHTLLMVMACEQDPPVAQLRKIRIFPTSDGNLVALNHTQLFDLAENFAPTLIGRNTLHPRFSNKIHPIVRTFLQKLGIQRINAPQLFEHLLLPRLKQTEPPTQEDILEWTRAARAVLDDCSEHECRSLVQQLREAPGFWVCVCRGKEEDCVVRVGDGVNTLHLYDLPARFQDMFRKPWLTPSPSYAVEEQASKLQEKPQSLKRHVLNWTDFWLLCGAWPFMSVEGMTCNGLNSVEEDYSSAELAALLDLIESAADSEQGDLALQLVTALVPHGKFYEDYSRTMLKSKGSAVTQTLLPSTMLMDLCSRRWVPLHDGKTVVSPRSGWLAPADTECPELERCFCFHVCAFELAHNWPSLGIDALPSVPTLMAVLRRLALQGRPCHAIAEMRALYAHVSRLESRGCADLHKFLRQEPWIFLPDHTNPHGSFSEAFGDGRGGEQRQRFGSFYKPQDLVFQDPSMLLDSYSAFLPDAARGIISSSSKTRVLANYYWGPMTLLPAKLQDFRDVFSSANVALHELFRRAGVRYAAAWVDYFAVLQGVDSQSAKSPPRALRAIVSKIFGHLEVQVRAELQRGEEVYFPSSSPRRHSQIGCAVNGSLEANGDTIGAAAAAATAAPATAAAAVKTQDTIRGILFARIDPECLKSSTLRQFVDRTLRLRCLPTRAGTWERLGQVLFFCDGCPQACDSDSEVARAVTDLAAISHMERMPDKGERLQRALAYCGIRHLGSSVIRRALATEDSTSMEPQIARLALVAAVGIATQTTPQPSRARLLAAAQQIQFAAASDLIVEEGVCVDKMCAQTLGLGAGLGSRRLVLLEPAGQNQLLQPNGGCSFVRTRRDPSHEELCFVGLCAFGEDSGQGTLTCAMASSAVDVLGAPRGARRLAEVVLNGMRDPALHADMTIIADKLIAALASIAQQLAATSSSREASDLIESIITSVWAGSVVVGAGLDEMVDECSAHLNDTQVEETLSERMEQVDIETMQQQRWAQLLEAPGEEYQSVVKFEVAQETDGALEKNSESEGADLLRLAKDALMPRARRQLEGENVVRVARKEASLDTAPQETFGGIRLPPDEDLSIEARQAMRRWIGKGDGQYSIGRLGEQIVALTLESLGSEVIWLNEDGDMCLPIDCLVFPPKHPSQDLCRALRTSGRLDKRKVQAYLANEKDAARRPGGSAIVPAFLEVKASNLKFVHFQVTLPEIETMLSLGSRYWIARVEHLHPHIFRNVTLTVWKDVGAAVRKGKGQLWIAT